jgi:hypothetical protein
MNKMSMYLALREWIDIGTSELIYDSPHQCSEYAPYVVEALLRSTPKKHIPGYCPCPVNLKILASEQFS